MNRVRPPVEAKSPIDQGTIDSIGYVLENDGLPSIGQLRTICAVSAIAIGKIRTRNGFNVEDKDAIFEGEVIVEGASTAQSVITAYDNPGEMKVTVIDVASGDRLTANYGLEGLVFSVPESN